MKLRFSVFQDVFIGGVFKFMKDWQLILHILSVFIFVNNLLFLFIIDILFFFKRKLVKASTFCSFFDSLSLRDECIGLRRNDFVVTIYREKIERILNFMNVGFGECLK